MSPSLNTRENRELATEIKFRVPRELAGEIREWVRDRLAADPNGGGEAGDTYHVTSVYFDTPDLDVFRRNGSYGRSKFRVRRYGWGEVVFLERKLKTRGWVSKRRARVQPDDLQRLSGLSADPGWPGFWYHRRLLLRRLQPVCQLGYDRTARCANSALGPIRVTLDEKLRARPAADTAFIQNGDGIAIAEEHAILEMKYRADLPDVFKELLLRFGLNPERLSKYRMAMVGTGLAGEPALSPAAGGTG